MISKKIFESFINNGGNFIQNEVNDIISETDLITLNYNNNKHNYEKVIILSLIHI